MSSSNVGDTHKLLHMPHSIGIKTLVSKSGCHLVAKHPFHGW